MLGSPIRSLARPLLALAVVAGTLIATAGTAEACSCAMPQVSEMLAQSDGAIVATMVERVGEVDERDFESDIAMTFQVDEWVKGQGADTIAIWGASNGAACGLETSPGQQVGLFLRQEGPRLVSGLCDTVSAGLLLAATATEVEVGTGPAQFALAGAFREGSIALLDADGLPIGYLGAPAEWSSALTACPGGSTVVQTSDAGIIITNLVTGEDRRLEFADDEFVTSVFCGDPSGPELRFVTERWLGNGPRYRLWVADPEPRILGELPVGSEAQVTVAAETVVIIEQDNRGGRVKVFDPETGIATVVTETVRGEDDNVAGYDRPAMSADGGRMVVNEVRYRSDADVESRVLVFDTASGEILVEQTYAEELYVRWLGDELVGLAGGLDSDSPSLAVLGASDLALLNTIEPWEAEAGPVVNGEIWATSFSGGSLLRASIDGGTVDTAAMFGATTSGEVVVLDQPIDPPAGLVTPLAGIDVEGGQQLTSEMPDGADASDAGIPPGDGSGGQVATDSDDGSTGSTMIWIVLGLLAGVAVGIGFGVARRR